MYRYICMHYMYMKLNDFQIPDLERQLRKVSSRIIIALFSSSRKDPDETFSKRHTTFSLTNTLTKLNTNYINQNV